MNNSLAVWSREEGVDGDLDAVDEEEAQAHEQLSEGVVRIWSNAEKQSIKESIQVETAQVQVHRTHQITDTLKSAQGPLIVFTAAIWSIFSTPVTPHPFSLDK